MSKESAFGFLFYLLLPTFILLTCILFLICFLKNEEQAKINIERKFFTKKDGKNSEENTKVDFILQKITVFFFTEFLPIGSNQKECMSQKLADLPSVEDEYASREKEEKNKKAKELTLAASDFSLRVVDKNPNADSLDKVLDHFESSQTPKEFQLPTEAIEEHSRAEKEDSKEISLFGLPNEETSTSFSDGKMVELLIQIGERDTLEKSSEIIKKSVALKEAKHAEKHEEERGQQKQEEESKEKQEKEVQKEESEEIEEKRRGTEDSEESSDAIIEKESKIEDEFTKFAKRRKQK